MLDAQHRIHLTCETRTTEDHRSGVVRLLASGANDIGYGEAGFARILQTWVNISGTPPPSMLVESNGAVVVIARWAVANNEITAFGQWDQAVARIAPNGAGLDPGFGYSAGYSRFRYEQREGALPDTADENAAQIALDPEGNYVISGTRTVNFAPYSTAARLLGPQPPFAGFADGFE